MEKRLDIGDVLSRALDLYGDHFKPLVMLAGIMSFAGAMLGRIMYEIGFDHGLTGSIATGIPQFLVGTLLSGMFVLLIADVRDGVQDDSLGRIFERTVPKLVPLLLTSLIVALAIMVGFLLIIVPGVIALVWFSLSGIVVMLEDREYLDAMSRSREIVSGVFWPMLGLMIVAGLIAAIAGGILSAVLGSLASGWLGAIIAATIAGALVQPFSASVPVLAYFDLTGGADEIDAAPDAGPEGVYTPPSDPSSL